ncbi:hypothetical protein C2E23DRAFT_437427 [Lenzites betulinus]|nr:hypothetical protein C2E23DRAFT_437427 [Lenzites betulinus]
MTLSDVEWLIYTQKVCRILRSATRTPIKCCFLDSAFLRPRASTYDCPHGSPRVFILRPPCGRRGRTCRFPPHVFFHACSVRFIKRFQCPLALRIRTRPAQMCERRSISPRLASPEIPTRLRAAAAPPALAVSPSSPTTPRRSPCPPLDLLPNLCTTAVPSVPSRPTGRRAGPRSPRCTARGAIPEATTIPPRCAWCRYTPSTPHSRWPSRRCSIARIRCITTACAGRASRCAVEICAARRAATSAAGLSRVAAAVEEHERTGSRDWIHGKISLVSWREKCVLVPLYMSRRIHEVTDV